MAKNHRIKRSKNIGGGSFKARPHPVAIILSILVVAGLVYLGASIYEPVYNFVMSLGSSEPSEVSEPDADEPGSDVSEPSETTPLPPEPDTLTAPTDLRAVYLPFETAADIATAKRFIDGVGDDINAVMVEIKNSQGQILYGTRNENAISWGAVSDRTIDLPGIVKLLKDKGLHLIVRMHVFSDPIAARADRENYPIKYQNSEMLWLDNYQDRGGKPWLNPYVPEVRQYLIDIAREAVEIGAVMVVMDSARFPDDMTGSATFGPASEGISRAQALKTFFDEADAALEPLGARVSAYIPATMIGSPQRESRYGGNPLAISNNIVLGILPELLETGYLAEGMIITRPATDLSKMVKEVLDYAKTQPGSNSPIIIPMLGASPSGVVPMTKNLLDTQTAASKDSGNPEYILYSQDGVYPF